MDVRLTIELVPQTCFWTNVRSAVTAAEWDRIRKQVYQKALRVCEVCGGVGSTHPVECHEIWHYDDKAHVQTLTGMIALCPACHEVKHFGRAESIGKGQKALKHLARVNHWTYSQADDYVEAQYRLWEERSKHQWTQDLAHLTQYGIAPDNLRKVSK